MPTIELLQKFEFLSEVMFQKSFQNNLQIDTLSNIRDVLLTKLMSGKIRVLTGTKK